MEIVEKIYLVEKKTKIVAGKIYGPDTGWRGPYSMCVRSCVRSTEEFLSFLPVAL